MIKFGFDGYDTEFPDWSKHHKKLSILVKRVYIDGKEILSKDSNLKEIVEKNEDKLIPKHVYIWGREDNGDKEAVDYYLPLNNLEYQDNNIEYYSVGASNTNQTTYVRFKFLIDDNLFIIEHSYKSEGHHAMSFHDLLDGMNAIEDVIESVLEEEKNIEDVGIIRGEDEDYRIVVATGELYPEDFEISKHELFRSLVAAEIYKFDQEIL